MKKLCFVIGPIGEPDSEARVHADWLLEEIIEPVFQGFPDFEVMRADKISQPGMIDAQIIRNLIDADLVIADLSMLNPNAFYEIGIRHMAQRPIIHMQLAADKTPFDVSLYRATKFSLARPSDLKKAREELRIAIQAVISKDYEVDNPITRVRGQIKLEQHATSEQRVMLGEIRSIQQRLETLESTSNYGRADDEIPGPGLHRGSIVIELEETQSGTSDISRAVDAAIASSGFISMYEFTGKRYIARWNKAITLSRISSFLRSVREIKGVEKAYRLPAQ